MIDEESQNKDEYEEGEYKEEDFENLVTVLSTDDLAVAAFAKKILDEAGVKYIVRGEGIQSLYGVGVTGVAGYDVLAEPIEISVLEEDSEKAIELLKDVENSEPLNDPGLTPDESDDPEKPAGDDTDGK